MSLLFHCPLTVFPPSFPPSFHRPFAVPSRSGLSWWQFRFFHSLCSNYRLPSTVMTPITLARSRSGLRRAVVAHQRLLLGATARSGLRVPPRIVPVSVRSSLFTLHSPLCSLLSSLFSLLTARILTLLLSPFSSLLCVLSSPLPSRLLLPLLLSCLPQIHIT